MAKRKPLTDEEIHTLLVHARDVLGHAPGETVRGNTTMETARRALVMLQIALLMSIENQSDEVPGVIPSDES